MNWDLSQWCPLIDDRCFLPWLVKGLTHFDEILQEADGIILSRGNLGIDLPPEKFFLFQKATLYKFLPALWVSCFLARYQVSWAYEVSIGLVVALNYQNPFLNPYEEFQKLKHHPAIKSMLEGGSVLQYGARTLKKVVFRKDEDKMIEGLGFDMSEVAEEGFDFTRDWKTVQTAILNFGRDRFDILRNAIPRRGHKFENSTVSWRKIAFLKDEPRSQSQVAEETFIKGYWKEQYFCISSSSKFALGEFSILGSKLLTLYCCNLM
ncbi:hypothetical protein Nepgr_018596 [Nepenthes gracilis]|uniref:Multifunctional fusion protein n=1 Tax=Nepenthes gracilis TaxID=150966 RepID=A0AAD3XUE9_NEPGR|nr:hypothetical protein Nepgr_018596 [Nepenthes gracilis]